MKGKEKSGNLMNSCYSKARNNGMGRTLHRSKTRERDPIIERIYGIIGKGYFGEGRPRGSVILSPGAFSNDAGKDADRRIEIKSHSSDGETEFKELDRSLTPAVHAG
ncbi:hypothetical protein AVEN_24739-1 [Araneus ventricosus]|uniref:Uncharacterized protein n=1 Tax=Araneus ventricosus TaxID=182803 RepID=A0A4Y2KZE2_ARAVE|nr:hypothetical protein AVEN_24739-1 [Araneus ventricosus]